MLQLHTPGTMAHVLGLKRKEIDLPVSNNHPKRVKTLLDDASSDGESSSTDGGVAIAGRTSNTDQPGFRINKEYARRFEHNKQREEMQQCELPLFCLHMMVLNQGSGRKVWRADP